MRFYIGAVGSFAYGTATELVDEVRFPHDTPLESSAEGADASVGGWVIDDPDGNYDVTGFRPAWADEDDCTPSRIWTGFVTLRRYKRAPGVRTGPGRIIEVDLVDINHLLKRKVIAGADGKRPHETDEQRITWLLGDVLGGVVFDNGLLDYSGGFLDEADFRDQYALDVLSDAAANTAKDFYVIWDETAATGEEVTLVYEARSATQRAADLSISNVLADQDLDEVWEPSEDSVLERTPEEVYSGVDLVYTGGRRVYLQNPTTLANFFGSGNLSRDLVVTSTRIGLESTALAQAAIHLTIHASERDIIDTRLYLPVDRVNWVMAGQSIVVRYTHFDGYETDTTMKVLRKSVIHPVPDRNRFYEVALRLASGEASEAGGGGGNPGDFPPPPPEEGDCVASDAEQQITGTATSWATPPRIPQVNPDTTHTSYGIDGHYGPGYGDPGPSGYEVAYDFFAENHNHYYCGYVVEFPAATNVTSFNLYWGSGGATQVSPDIIRAGTGAVPVDETSGGPDLSFSGPSANAPPGHASSDGYSKFTLSATAEDVTWLELIWDHGTFGPGLDVHAIHSFREIGIYLCIPTVTDPVPPLPGQHVGPETIDDTGDAGHTFTTASPFADGSLEIELNSVPQPGTVTSYDGATGEFTLTFDVNSADTLIVRYVGR